MKYFILVISLIVSKAEASGYPNADFELSKLTAVVERLKRPLAHLPVDLKEKVWVRAKIFEMAAADQTIRLFPYNAIVKSLTFEEGEYFKDKVLTKMSEQDKENLEVMKQLLKTVPWFTIGEYGKTVDADAWLIVQHQDRDVAFQKLVLERLEKLYPSGDTSPSNYAYLYDRVAVNELRKQRYGTQGFCVGPKNWQPREVENPEKIDELRKSVELIPLQEYIKLSSQWCVSDESYKNIKFIYQ